MQSNLDIEKNVGDIRLKMAIKEERIEDVELILKEGLKERESFAQYYDKINVGSPLHDAVFSNQIEIVKMLLDNGAMVNYIDPVTQETAIHWAAKYGHLEILKHIASNDDFLEIKDGTASQNTPIHTATNYGKIDVIKWLVTVKSVSVNSFNKNGYTPLLSAVRREDSYLTQELINLGADVDCRSKDTEGMTPLHLAVKCGAENIVRILLVSGASTRIYCKKYGYTPLHWAVRLGLLEILKLIYCNDPDLSCRTNDKNGDELVHLAAKFGHIQIMAWLLTKGCLLDKPNKRGYTPLHISVMFSQNVATDFLITNNVKLDRRTSNRHRRTALHIAASKGLDGVVSLLLNKGADANAVNGKRFIPLHLAIKKNKVKCVEILFNASAALVESSRTLRYRSLFMASKSDAEDTVRFLIQNGIEVNIQDNNRFTALHFSAGCGALMATKVLLDNGANVNACNFKLHTPIHCATYHGYYDIIALLLQFGADVNATCDVGHHAAHYAAYGNHVRCLELLISAQCNLNVLCKGRTPIHIAAIKGHVDIISLLFENGVSINAIDGFRKTPLCYAVSARNCEVIEFLLRNNADVNYLDDTVDQVTLLHKAVDFLDAKLMKLLIENGASLEFRTRKGETPLLYAVKKGRFGCMVVLINAGADINTKDNLGEGIFYYARVNHFEDQLKEYLIRRTIT